MSRWRRQIGVAMTPILSVFGEPVEYRPADPGVAPRVVTGILKEGHTSVDPGGRTRVSTTAPTLTVRIADLPSQPVPRDGLRVDGRDWVVRDVRPDGGGNAVLQLHRDHGA